MEDICSEPARERNRSRRLAQQSPSSHSPILGDQDLRDDGGGDRRRRSFDDVSTRLCGQQPDLPGVLRRHSGRAGRLEAVSSFHVLGRRRCHDDRRHDDVGLHRSHPRIRLREVVDHAVLRRYRGFIRLVVGHGPSEVREHYVQKGRGFLLGHDSCVEHARHGARRLHGDRRGSGFPARSARLHRPPRARGGGAFFHEHFKWPAVLVRIYPIAAAGGHTRRHSHQTP